jgi:hypothetical protein
LKELTDTVNHLDRKIREVEGRMEALVSVKDVAERDVGIVSSVPGVGEFGCGYRG